jgi:signal peptide peptidase SppA
VGAIAPHSTATTDVAWDIRTNERRLNTPLTQSVAAGFYAWKEGNGWPTDKSSYKFGHHMVAAGGQPGAANLRACSASIAVLNGGRGGSTIPSSDRQGVYNHVAKHLRSAGREPPPLGASVEESEAFCDEIDALEAQAMEPGMEECPTCEGTGEVPEKKDGKEDAKESSGLVLPPLLPVGHSAWAIQPDVLPQLVEGHRVAAAMDGHLPLGAVMQYAKLAGQMKTAGAVAVIPLSGILTPRGSFLSMLFGGGMRGLVGFREQFREAMNSADVGTIVLDVDSPGGLVSLIPETAEEVFQARGSKPIIAVANTLAASAAYWIASQADELVVTPSGEAGSIGVYMIHRDVSGMNARVGVAPQYVKAGRYKTEGNPDEPLGDEGEAQWQAECDELWGMFVNAVAQGRGVSAAAVRGGYGEGRSLRAQPALEAGLVDKIAPLEEVMAELLGLDTEDDAPVPGARADTPPPDKEKEKEEEEEGEPDEDDEEEKPKTRMRPADVLFS